MNVVSPPIQNKSSTNEWYIVGLVFSVLALIIALGLLFYAFYYQNQAPKTPCETNGQCLSNQVCSDRYCTDKTCKLNSDCNTNAGQACVLGYCLPLSCSGSNTCPSGSVCSNTGECVPLGATCGSSADCFQNQLICVKGGTATVGTCRQCGKDEDCPNNGTCSNGICYASCSNGTTGPGVCNTEAGFQCVQGSCCPAGVYPIGSCSVASKNDRVSCGQNSFCVNDRCGCVKGKRLDTCLDDKDCSSGICNAGICLNSGDTCAFNAKTSNIPSSQSKLICDTKTPYCNNGTCSTSSLGAPCSAFQEVSKNPTYKACNLYVDPNGPTPPVTNVYYCVNGFCNVNPGNRGDDCTITQDCNTGLSYVCLNQVCEFN